MPRYVIKTSNECSIAFDSSAANEEDSKRKMGFRRHRFMPSGRKTFRPEDGEDMETKYG